MTRKKLDVLIDIKYGDTSSEEEQELLELWKDAIKDAKITKELEIIVDPEE